jgi:hypothetical protein
LLHEFISPGDTAVVLDVQGIGRLAVMICEDLYRTSPGRWLGRRLFLDWMFAPIFDASIEESNWVHKASKPKAETGGHRIVVANSISMTIRQNNANKKAGKSKYLLDRCVIGLLIDNVFGTKKPNVTQVQLSSEGPVTQPVIRTVQWHADE